MQITPLPQGFGATISGFDTHDGRDPEDVAALRAAYDRYNLLLFHADADLAPERQVEIAGWFGPVGGGASNPTPWTVLDNEEAIGREILPFHSDITFLRYPLDGISLYPVALPDGDTSTTFISNAVGWDALPDRLKTELEGRDARHYFASGRTIDLDLPFFEYWHPAKMAHPRTGRPLLFVTEHHVDRLSGMADDRATEILEEAFAVLYAPERRYEHVWRPGDLLVWDNLAIQHARTRIAAPSAGRRIMRRVTMQKMGYAEQVEALRQAAA